MNVTIAIPLTLILGLVVAVMVIIAGVRGSRRRKRQARLRQKQEAARLKAVEKSMQPSLAERAKSLVRR